MAFQNAAIALLATFGASAAAPVGRHTAAAAATATTAAAPPSNHPIGVLPSSSRHRRGAGGLSHGGDPELWVGGGKVVPWASTASPSIAPGYQVYSEFDGLANQWGSDTPKVEANIRWAIDHLEANTGLRFVEYDPEAHSAYVLFGMFHPEYCSAPGPSTTGLTFVNLGWCKDTESILHEILHILGISHTQSRSDRDVYVDVADGAGGNYGRATEDYSQGLPYDFGSVMHYGLSSVMTLTPDGAKRLAEQSLTASKIGMGDGNGGINPSDAEHINRMYFGGDISGDFVIDGYDSNKNDWHYAKIEEQGGLAAAQPECVGDRATYDAGYGSCSSYALGAANHGWCNQDVDADGNVAEGVCSECGVCGTEVDSDDVETAQRVFSWTNRAGVSWTLTQKALSPAQFEVGTDCPYYSQGYTVATAKLDANGEVVGLSGPSGELYDKLGAPQAGYAVLPHTSEVCGKGCGSPGVTCIQKPMPTEECRAICDGEEGCKAFQEPADNGFHHWCVLFDYTPEQAAPSGSQQCHSSNFVYAKQHVTAPWWAWW